MSEEEPKVIGRSIQIGDVVEILNSGTTYREESLCGCVCGDAIEKDGRYYLEVYAEGGRYQAPPSMLKFLRRETMVGHATYREEQS